MRAVPGALFLILGLIYAAIGVWSGESGLAAYSIPLAWATVPGLIPFSAAILSVAIGVIYLAIDRKSSRGASVTIAFAQLAAFVLGMTGYAAVARFWSVALGPNPPASPRLPLRSGGLAAMGLTATLLLFIANLWRMRARDRKPQVPAT